MHLPLAVDRVPARFQEKGWFPAQCATRIEEDELSKKDR